MTATLTAPQWNASVWDNEDDPIHLVCCDPDRALCGELMPGDCWVPDDDEGEECAVCAFYDEMGSPCGALFCRLRRAWRDRNRV